MTRKIIFTILILQKILLSSCVQEDFLDEVPRDRLTADNLYLNPSGFENGLNALFASVRMERNNNPIGTENMRSVFSQISTDATFTGRWTPADNGFVEWGSFMNPLQRQLSPVWNWLYEVINSSNTIIDRSENPDIVWDNETQKDIVLAQAKFIRAWAYRHLTYTWGSVPLILNESTGTNIRTDWIREPLENIINSMEEDWLFAEQHLPETHPIPGRLNKAVARHFLSELYLLKGDDSKAEEKAMAVINSGFFNLITERYGVRSDQPGVPFMDQFYNGNVFRNQGNTEVLWEMPHDRDVIGGGGNYMRRVWLARYSSLSNVSVSPERGRGNEFLAVTKYAWGLYEDQDHRGSRYAVHREIISNDGDTIFTSTEGREEPRADPLWPSTRKWDDGDPTNPGRNEGYNDQPYIRLAETYLLLAEAKYKLGKNEEAAESINILRRRANASEIGMSDVSIDFILEERIRELLTEEHRRYTLNRLDKWLERTILYNKQCGPFIRETHKLYPIPQTVIDANIGLEMPQNPGY